MITMPNVREIVSTRPGLEYRVVFHQDIVMRRGHQWRKDSASIYCNHRDLLDQICNVAMNEIQCDAFVNAINDYAELSIDKWDDDDFDGFDERIMEFVLDFMTDHLCEPDQ